MQNQMSPTEAGRLGLGKKAVRAAIAIVGLLIISAIVSALPMVRDAAPLYHRSWLDLAPSAAGSSGPFAGTLTADPQAVANALKEWTALMQSDPQLLGGAASTSAYRADVIAVLEGQHGSVAAGALRAMMTAAAWAIFPVNIVHAAIATLAFLVLFGLAGDIRVTVEESPRFPELGQAAELGILVAIVALAYDAYHSIAFPLLGPSLRSVYGWVFLAGGLVLLCWAVALVSRNLDAVTAAVFQPRRPRPAAPRCPGCGAPTQPGASFCPRCGVAAAAPVNAARAVQARCAQCGGELKPGARFCGACGRAFA